MVSSSLLEAEDSYDIARSLHNQYRNKLAMKTYGQETLLNQVLTVIQDFKRRRLPPHPMASLHIMSYFNESHQYDLGIEFWGWTIRQNDNYVNMRTYGAAIELLTAYGKPLEYLEEVYAHALSRFSEASIGYHISSKAIAADRAQSTGIAGTSMLLQQGILKARLIHGDWQNAYLALDTALRRYPTQLPTRIFDYFMHERPLPESYKVFCLACRSGSTAKPKMFTYILDEIAKAQTLGENPAYNLDLAKAMLNALQAYMGTGTTANIAHLNILIRGLLAVVPAASDGLGSETQPVEDDELCQRTSNAINLLLKIFALLGVAPAVPTFNAIIFLSGRLGRKRLVSVAMAGLKEAGLEPNQVTYRSLLGAAGRLQDADFLKEVWKTYRGATSELGTKLSLGDWTAFARAGRNAHAEAYVHEELLTHESSTEPDVPKTVRLELTRPKDPPTSQRRSLRNGHVDDKPVRYVDNILASLLAIGEQLMSSRLQNFYQTSLRMSLWGVSQGPPEEWQKTLYDELFTQPKSKLNPEHNKEPSSAVSGMSPTGFPLDELRYQNWRTVNELLFQAEAGPQRHHQTIEKALLQGNLLPRSNSKEKPYHSQIEARGLVKLWKIQSRNAECDTLEQDDEAGWRKKILRLRRLDDQHLTES